jgi:hypothetical protein
VLGGEAFVGALVRGTRRGADSKAWPQAAAVRAVRRRTAPATRRSRTCTTSSHLSPNHHRRKPDHSMPTSSPLAGHLGPCDRGLRAEVHRRWPVPGSRRRRRADRRQQAARHRAALRLSPRHEMTAAPPRPNIDRAVAARVGAHVEGRRLRRSRRLGGQPVRPSGWNDTDAAIVRVLVERLERGLDRSGWLKELVDVADAARKRGDFPPDYQAQLIEEMCGATTRATKLRKSGRTGVT